MVVRGPESNDDAFRPTLDDNDDVIVNSQLRAMVKKCWREIPQDRPSFGEIHQQMKKIFRFFIYIDSSFFNIKMNIFCEK